MCIRDSAPSSSARRPLEVAGCTRPAPSTASFAAERPSCNRGDGNGGPELMRLSKRRSLRELPSVPRGLPICV
eukprot:2821721-Alexandrium_andersonii.AAC.1